MWSTLSDWAWGEICHKWRISASVWHERDKESGRGVSDWRQWLQAAEKWRLRVMNAAHNSNCDSNHSYVCSSLQPQGDSDISHSRFCLRVSLHIACGRVTTALTYTINPHEVWDYIKYSVVLDTPRPRVTFTDRLSTHGPRDTERVIESTFRALGIVSIFQYHFVWTKWAFHKQILKDIVL